MNWICLILSVQTVCQSFETYLLATIRICSLETFHNYTQTNNFLWSDIFFIPDLEYFMICGGKFRYEINLIIEYWEVIDRTVSKLTQWDKMTKTDKVYGIHQFDVLFVFIYIWNFYRKTEWILLDKQVKKYQPAYLKVAERSRGDTTISCNKILIRCLLNIDWCSSSYVLTLSIANKATIGLKCYSAIWICANSLNRGKKQTTTKNYREKKLRFNIDKWLINECKSKWKGDGNSRI